MAYLCAIPICIRPYSKNRSLKSRSNGVAVVLLSIHERVGWKACHPSGILPKACSQDLPSWPGSVPPSEAEGRRSALRSRWRQRPRIPPSHIKKGDLMAERVWIPPPDRPALAGFAKGPGGYFHERFAILSANACCFAALEPAYPAVAPTSPRSSPIHLLADASPGARAGYSARPFPCEPGSPDRMACGARLHYGNYPNLFIRSCPRVATAPQNLEVPPCR